MSRAKIDWRVPSAEWESFVEFVYCEYGDNERYVSREVEQAMREWADLDGLAPIEKRVNRLVRAAGRTVEDSSEKKIASTSPEDEDTTRVSHRVDAQVKNDFAEFVSQTTGDRLGLVLARALRQHRMADRPQRLLNKLNRVVDDAESLLAEMSEDDKLNTRQKRTIAICNHLGDQFTRSELEDAIRSVVGDSPPTIRDYTEKVLARRNAVKHPNNSELYIPEATVRKLGVDPNAPAIDRKPYDDLTREEKVHGLQVVLASRSLASNGKYQANVQKVKREIFDREPSDSHSRELIRLADEARGFNLANREGKLRLRVDIEKVTDRSVLEAASSRLHSNSPSADDEGESLKETVPVINSGQNTEVR
jgi:hypothetical protein